MDGFGYTRLTPQSTNLPLTIWFGTPMGFDGGFPRILAAKVLGISKQLDHFFSILLEDGQVVEDDTGSLPASAVSDVKEFVRLNQFAFMAHWLGKIDTVETIGLLAIPDRLGDREQRRSL